MSEKDDFDGHWTSTSGTVTVTMPDNQVEMFTIDIENRDSDGYSWHTSMIDDMCLPAEPVYNVTTTMAGYGNVHTANYMATEAESKASQIEYQAKLFKDSVQDLLNNILRVSPAGSGSYQLAQNFMGDHYGEESK